MRAADDRDGTMRITHSRSAPFSALSASGVTREDAAALVTALVDAA